MSFALGVAAATQGVVSRAARNWFRNCVTVPGQRDLQAIDLLLRRASAGGWGARIKFFGAHEASVQACSLISRKGSFIGDFDRDQGVGSSATVSSDYFDCGETFAQIAAATGATPNNHGVIVVTSSDFAGDAETGALGGGSHISVRARSSVGTMGVRCCTGTIVADIANASNYGPHGYLAIGGNVYAVRRQIVDGQEVTNTFAIATTPGAWPTGTWQIARAGTEGSYSSNQVLAVIVIANPTLAMVPDMVDTFDKIYRIYGTRDEIYNLLHVPAFTGPYPLDHSHLAFVEPEGAIVTRLGQPPFDETVDGTTKADLTCNHWITTPNALPKFDPETTDEFDVSSMLWNHRAIGRYDGEIYVKSPRGNNTYGAIQTPIGFGRPMYTYTERAMRATLAQMLYYIGGYPINDPLFVFDDPMVAGGAVPTGYLDLLAPVFNVAAYRSRAQASADVSIDPDFITSADNGITGDVVTFGHALAHPEIFDRKTDQGYLCFDRVIWPPTRYPAPVRGGSARFKRIVWDDEQSDGRYKERHLWFYQVSAAIGDAFGLEVVANPHALNASGRKSGWHPDVNHLIIAAGVKVLMKFGRKMPNVDGGAAFDAQWDDLRNPSGDPPPPDKVGISVNIGARNNPILLSDAALIRERRIDAELLETHIVPAGAQFRARWNDPVILALAEVLGVPETELVGYGS